MYCIFFSIAYTPPNQCGGVAAPVWTVYNSVTITTAISTAACSFSATPAYFTSVGGTGRQLYLRGYDSIYSPTTNSFRIYVRSMLGENATTMMSYSQTYTWVIYWFGMYGYTDLFFKNRLCFYV